MPCDSIRTEGQTLVERMSQVQRALKRLEGYLSTGSVTIGISPTGAVVFKGWNDRDAVTDVCAYRTLAAENSWSLRQSVARAEALAGRKVNANAVALGVHSHDGGKTWGAH